MLEPCAVKVASTVLRRGLHREMGFLSDELLENDKIFRAIKTEYAKGTRNTTLSCNEGAVLKIETVKKVHTFEVSKNDFADLLVLAEEHAKNKKLLKKDCDRVKLVDIETMS